MRKVHAMSFRRRAMVVLLSAFLFGAVAALFKGQGSGVRAVLGSRYFLAGLVSGPAFGAIGTWWNAHRSARASIGIGLLLLGEPLVQALVRSMSMFERLAGGFAEMDAQPYVAEFLLGLALLAAAYLMGQFRLRAAATSIYSPQVLRVIRPPSLGLSGNACTVPRFAG